MEMHFPKEYVKEALFIHLNTVRNFGCAGCAGCPYLGVSSCVSKLCEDALYWMDQLEKIIKKLSERSDTSCPGAKEQSS